MSRKRESQQTHAESARVPSQDPQAEVEGEAAEHEAARTVYFGLMSSVAIATMLRIMDIQDEIDRKDGSFFLRKRLRREERTQKTDAAMESIDAAVDATLAFEHALRELLEARNATASDFEQTFRVMFDGAFNASFHTGRAAAFVEMAIQSSRDGKRKDSTKNQITARNAEILRRAEDLEKFSAEMVGFKLAHEFALSHGSIARIVREARNQKRNLRNHEPDLKKTGSRTHGQGGASDLDPT